MFELHKRVRMTIQRSLCSFFCMTSAHYEQLMTTIWGDCGRQNRKLFLTERFLNSV